MASDSMTDPCAKRLDLEQPLSSKQAIYTNNETKDWLSGEGPNLLGGIATYFNLRIDLTNMVVALVAGRRSEGKDISRVVKGVYLWGNNVYLDRVLSSLPPSNMKFSDNDGRWEQIRRARDKLREWMIMNLD